MGILQNIDDALINDGKTAMPLMSADELIESVGSKMNSYQKDYVNSFLERWEKDEKSGFKHQDELVEEYTTWTKKQRIKK